MNDTLDLEQLAVRESEQVEWKETVADTDDVVRTLSAFANDLANLGGGYVVCGAAERKDEHGFQRVERVGVTASRMKELEGKILQLCRDCVDPPLTPQVAELPSETADKRVLVFVQPATGHAHSFRSHDKTTRYWVRIGRETREARNGTLRELLVRKGALEPWDRRACNGATVSDLDLLALRDALQRMRVFSADVGVEAYLSDDKQLSPFVPSLFVRESLTGTLRPRNFAILLFGLEPQRFIPGAFSLFSIYPGQDRSDPHAERHEIAGTLIEQARRLSELLDVQSFTAFDKTDASSPNAVKYPKRALYEAMGNALAHRDYEINDPTRVTVFEHRIEIRSPGSLPYGVNSERFKTGKAGPRWRNQALAWFFNRLQLAQAEGQGIPTIFRSMREEGCPPPGFVTEEVAVTCILPAHPRHALLREYREVEQSLALGELQRSKEKIAELLQRDMYNARGLQLFGEVQTVLRDPEPVFNMLTSREFDISRLPRSAALQLSEALLSGGDTSSAYRSLASQLLKSAAFGGLEERELRRVGVAMLRNRDEQALLDLIERNSAAHPEWSENPSILQLKGDAFIGLAKRCRNAAGRKNLPARTRDRSWGQFHDYVETAERLLKKAEGLSVDPGISALVRRNLDYVEELKRKHSYRLRRPRSN